ncbi:cytochrome P450 4C1 [Fopius arisanus]|uniref:Cytochrome P450 4C1 n=2 Tax=Fopius arisanus TaxID=64838 RepID=A0A9R1U3C6_9HYME|nr:PREDICTED: cytochrome P450 4C1-like [Fopius arisanus]
MEILSVLFVFLSLIIAYKIIKKINKYYSWRCRANKIPGPRARFPIIGVSWELIKTKPEDRIGWFHKIAKRYKDGIFITWIGFDATIHINTPENAEIILRSTKHIDKGLAYNYLVPWLGKGLLTSSGEKWFHDRKLITPTFHFGILEDFAEVMVEKSAILNQRLKEQVQLHGNEPFDIFRMMGKCALDIICETAMGVNVDAQGQIENEYNQAVETISTYALNRVFRPWLKPDWIYYMTEKGKKFKAAIETTHKRCTHVIEQKKSERQQNLNSDDNIQNAFEGIGGKKRRAFLDLLLECSENTKEPLTIEQIQEQVNTFMFAGHDTTGALMSWALFSIGNDETVQNNIHRELDEVFEETNEPVTTKQVPHLKYLDRVIKEVLRLYPSAPSISRGISKDLEIGSYTVPGGCTLAVQIYQLHRDPRHWPNPTHFDPDRFLPDRAKDRHPYSYIPFSGGLRNCIGQKFAVLEAKILLTEILRKWKVKSLQNHENIKYRSAIILRPHEGIFMNFYPRH